jgi:hypothetical protein
VTTPILLVLRFEDRALLDVVLEIGMHLAGADLLVADPADALQFVAEALALGILAAIGIVEAELAGEDARRHHGGSKAGALLVRPVDDDDGALGPDAEVVQRTDQFETGKHAEDAVITAAGRLGVEMAADIDRVELRLGAFAAGEHGAHLVDADGEAGIIAPFLEELPPFRIGVGQRLAVAAAGNAGADLGDLMDRIPQPVGIDAEIVGGIGHGRLIRVREPHSLTRAFGATSPDRGEAKRRLVDAARRPHQCCVLGKVNTAPDLMPSGQRVVTVFRRV